MTTEFERSKERQEALEAFRKTPEVSKWLELVKGGSFEVDAKGRVTSKGTKRTYSSGLYTYWSEFLSKNYPTLQDWIKTVKDQRKSEDQMVRKTWALDVIKFNKRGVSTGTQELLCSSVKSFLRAWVDEELDYNFKLSLSNEEMMDKQNEEAMSLEDMRKIYNECQSNRDRALILVAANGVGPEEMIQFTQRWREWFPKNPEDLKAPFRVKLVRVKKQFPYHLTLFEDACEALRALYEERREGIAKGEEMFISETDSKGRPTPFLYTTYGYVWENLRIRYGSQRRRLRLR